MNGYNPLTTLALSSWAAVVGRRQLSSQNLHPRLVSDDISGHKISEHLLCVYDTYNVLFCDGVSRGFSSLSSSGVQLGQIPSWNLWTRRTGIHASGYYELDT